MAFRTKWQAGYQATNFFCIANDERLSQFLLIIKRQFFHEIYAVCPTLNSTWSQSTDSIGKGATVAFVSWNFDSLLMNSDAFAERQTTRLGSFGRTSTRCEKPFETRCPAVWRIGVRTPAGVSTLVYVQRWPCARVPLLRLSLATASVRVLQNSWQINVGAFTATSLFRSVVHARAWLVCRTVEITGLRWFKYLDNWTFSCQLVHTGCPRGDVRDS